MTDGFTADVDAIRRLGRQVGRAGGDLSDIVWQTGMSNSVDLGPLGNLQLNYEKYREIVKTAVDDTNKAGALGTKSGSALKSVAGWYATNEKHAEEQFEKQYKDRWDPATVRENQVFERPPGQRQFTDIYKNPTEFAIKDFRRERDMPRPGSDAYDERWGFKAADEAEKILDKASVSAEVRNFVNYVVNTIPGGHKYGDGDFVGFLIGLVSVTGFWEMLDEQAVAFSQASSSVGYIKDNVDRGRYEIQDAWQGSAADEARQWLERYARCLGKHSDFLAEGADRITNFCYQIYSGYKLINRALDEVIGLLGKYATIAAGVWNLIKGENAGQVIASVAASLTPALSAISAIQAAVDAFNAWSNAFAARAAVHPAEWPGEPYEQPEEMR